MPNGITVANSSCLIALKAIGKLDLLSSLYGGIFIPAAVALECGSLPSWIQSQQVHNQNFVHSLQMNLGSGEAEAIALAMEVKTDRLILDDKKARQIAIQFGLPVTGTMGVLLRAKTTALIPLVRPVIADLQRTGFYISPSLEKAVLNQAGE